MKRIATLAVAAGALALGLVAITPTAADAGWRRGYYGYGHPYAYPRWRGYGWGYGPHALRYYPYAYYPYWRGRYWGRRGWGY